MINFCYSPTGSYTSEEISNLQDAIIFDKQNQKVTIICSDNSGAEPATVTENFNFLRISDLCDELHQDSSVALSQKGGYVVLSALNTSISNVSTNLASSVSKINSSLSYLDTSLLYLTQKHNRELLDVSNYFSNWITEKELVTSKAMNVLNSSMNRLESRQGSIETSFTALRESVDSSLSENALVLAKALVALNTSIGILDTRVKELGAKHNITYV